jgi:TetR/AcrR family transcriptional repressor of nem operon
MSEAGLTHGGFYKHFDSKGQLVAEACAAGIAEIVGTFEAAATQPDDEASIKSIVDGYLSTSHRDNRARGCPLAGMGSELVRGDEKVRAIAAEGFNDLVEVMAKRIRRGQPEEARSEAVFALAAMIGAVTMSRIITDPNAALSVLTDVKQRLDRI